MKITKGMYLDMKCHECKKGSYVIESLMDDFAGKYTCHNCGLIKYYHEFVYVKPKKKYWYHITYTECVLCGRGETIRERVYGKKPKKFDKCVSYEQYACDNHF